MYIGPDNIPIDFEHQRSNFKVTRGHSRSNIQTAISQKLCCTKFSFFYSMLAWLGARPWAKKIPIEIDPQGFIRDFVIFAFILIILNETYKILKY